MKIFTFRVTQPLTGFYEGFVDIEANSEEEGRTKLKEMDNNKLDDLCYDWEQNTDNAYGDVNDIIIGELFETDENDENDDIDEFNDLYYPELDAEYDIKLYETFGTDLEYVTTINNKSPNRVWTVIDDEGMYIVPGYRFVNRINYIICEKPWDENSEDYKY